MITSPFLRPPQFAFLRSSSYNPLYYNPKVSYAPWPPAYVGGAKTSYANANTAAAKSHPVYGAGTFDLSVSRALTKVANNTFMALPGMVIPAGSETCPHPACGAWTAEAAQRTVPANTILRLAMSYHPATYYVKEACVVGCRHLRRPRPTAARCSATRSRTAMPSPSGRSYADELQNFANWLQYYRKRKLMLSAAMGEVLEPLTGLRMGVIRVKFNRSTPDVTMYDADALLPRATA